MVAGPAAAQGSTFTKLSKEKRGRGRGPQASQALLTEQETNVHKNWTGFQPGI